MEYHLSYQGVPLEGPEPYQLSSIRSLMSEHAESPNCACTCHRVTDTCALTGPHRHPRTGCCVCCPTIAVPWQALADTYVTLGRVGYVLRIAEPLLVVGDVLDLYDRSGSAPYEVASIERVMTLPPRQVVNGCQSVLLKPLPVRQAVDPHAQHFAVTKEALFGEPTDVRAQVGEQIAQAHDEAVTRVPDLRTRVALTIRDAYRRRGDGEGDHEEWWYEAADAALTTLIAEET